MTKHEKGKMNDFNRVAALDRAMGSGIVKQDSKADPKSEAAANNAADDYMAARKNGDPIKSAIDKARPKL